MANQTALVLAGGGSKGDFEVGAVKYLFERGIRPDIICGCSAGALNAVRLTEGAGAETRLERDWRSLTGDRDMWEEEPWLKEVSLGFSQLFGGIGSGFIDWCGASAAGAMVSRAATLLEIPGSPFIPVSLFTGPFTVASIVHLGIDLGELTDGLSKAKHASSIYSLSPTRARLSAGLDRTKVAESGIKLRLGTVSLESGNIHFVDEQGNFALTQDEMGRLVPDSNPTAVDILDAAIASASVPFVFPPVGLAGESFIDGGVRDMLPIAAAVACGAQTIYAVTAGRLGAPPWQLSEAPKPGGVTLPPMVWIGLRATSDIMPDQILTDDLFPGGGWGVPVTRIMPTLTVHDGLTIDPGLIAISIDYGYMRAAEALNHPSGNRDLQELSDAIIRARVELWRREHFLSRQPPPGWTGPGRPIPDPAELTILREGKRELRELAQRYLVAGGVLPANKSDWWRGWEKHPFPLPNPSPWDRFASELGTLEPEPVPRPIWPDPGSLRTEFSDYDGDGRSDLAVWRPGDSQWFVFDGRQTQQWGQAGDIPVPGDYDGDGKTDIAVWRPGSTQWFVLRSSDGGRQEERWGQAGDIPVPGDYDGDGKTDFAVWRPASGEWFVIHSSDGSQITQQCGQAGDIPVLGDYDGDDVADFAVWRPQTGEWLVISSVSGTAFTQRLGQAGDIPVPGDYDGDGKIDFAVWRPQTGEWLVIESFSGLTYTQQWGQEWEIPLSNLLTPGRRFVVTVVPSIIHIGKPMDIRITAVDSVTGEAVPGSEVIITNFTPPKPPNRGGDPVTLRHSADPPYTTKITFHYGREFDGETRTTSYDVEPEIRVAAPNYIDEWASLTFKKT